MRGNSLSVFILQEMLQKSHLFAVLEYDSLFPAAVDFVKWNTDVAISSAAMVWHS